MMSPISIPAWVCWLFGSWLPLALLALASGSRRRIRKGGGWVWCVCGAVWCVCGAVWCGRHAEPCRCFICLAPPQRARRTRWRWRGAWSGRWARRAGCRRAS
ncbi:hypothetical protein B0T18DRAFT_223307 [Schizothecium vesticola]|uniref:Uncharacterized protein n=1 Tax=Schizothecium vesticola TaxID=314040 RepID=A0AA40EKH7_9PEZI|nr:hypothetical protein B0T18DRAFT_223307 [Schizothecium vesticola]